MERLAEYFRVKGFEVEKDKEWRIQYGAYGSRVSSYYPDVTATRTIVVEVNGPVGHSSQRSYYNELNQRAFFENQGIGFYTYSPQEIVGKGWIDSKGKRHRPHKPTELFQDWSL